MQNTSAFMSLFDLEFEFASSEVASSFCLLNKVGDTHIATVRLRKLSLLPSSKRLTISDGIS